MPIAEEYRLPAKIFYFGPTSVSAVWAPQSRWPERSRPHHCFGPSRPAIGKWWSSRLVATAEDRLSIKRNPPSLLWGDSATVETSHSKFGAQPLVLRRIHQLGVDGR